MCVHTDEAKRQKTVYYFKIEYPSLSLFVGSVECVNFDTFHALYERG